MVVQLRQTLNEKTKKCESMMNQKQKEIKKSENEEAVNKAIQMVVLNTAIGIFFKLPVSFIPILNVFADMYYYFGYDKTHPDFAYFYRFLIHTQFYNLIEDMSNLLFTLSLSIQVFIYYRFDKEFQIGYQTLKENAVTYIKNIFKYLFSILVAFDKVT